MASSSVDDRHKLDVFYAYRLNSTCCDGVGAWRWPSQNWREIFKENEINWIWSKKNCERSFQMATVRRPLSRKEQYELSVRKSPWQDFTLQLCDM